MRRLTTSELERYIDHIRVVFQQIQIVNGDIQQTIIDNILLCDKYFGYFDDNYFDCIIDREPRAIVFYSGGQMLFYFKILVIDFENKMLNIQFINTDILMDHTIKIII